MKSLKNVSLLQTLIISYIVINIPTTIFAYFMLKAVDDELAIHRNFVESDKLELTHENNDQLVSFGAILRKYSLPFSKKNDEDLYIFKETSLQNWTESLYRKRAALIYCWIILVLFGGVVYLSHGFTVQRIFRNLATALDSLRKYKSVGEIQLSAPFDLSDLSTSLENLRLNMTQKEVQQQRFLRHISHEIKTPLTSIKEGSKLLDDQILGQMNSEQREITNILVRSSNELQRAIEHLLDYNEAIAIRKAKHRKPSDVADHVRAALTKHELPIKQKRLVVKTSLSICHGNIDASQITTVFENLISNAVKQSPTGGVLEITLDKSRSGEIIFFVKDQGPGVNRDDKEAIFDPFYVGKQTNVSTVKGTGLGLSIAKQYIEEHNGSISALDSRNGAIFKVVLPTR